MHGKPELSAGLQPKRIEALPRGWEQAAGKAANSESAATAGASCGCRSTLEVGGFVRLGATRLRMLTLPRSSQRELL